MRHLPFALTFLLLAQCSLLNKQKEDNNDALLLLLGQTGSNCILSGQSFVTSGDVSCSGGVASGTGTLTAVGNKDEIFMQVSPTIGAGGFIRVFAYAPSGNIADASSVGVQFTAAGAVADYQHFDAAFSQNGTTFCLEFHGEHDHILYRNTACSTAIGTEVAFTKTDTPETWGFVLNNATLGGLAFFSDGQLTE